MPNPIAVRLFDASLGFLLRPRARRVRRWSFVVTAPLLFLAGRALGVGLGDGFALGMMAALLDAAVVAGVAIGGARLLGGERRDALLDLLMHPVARRAVVGEARMLSTIPAALLRRARPARGVAFSYHRGSSELGLVVALLPAMAAEAAAVHLLLPAGWLVPKLVLAGLHVYGVIMLLSWAVAQRTVAHRILDGEVQLHYAQLYRARVAARDIAASERVYLRDGQQSGLLLAGTLPRLAVGGRTDVLLRFAVPVCVERPLGAPTWVTELAVRVDDPAGFVRGIEAARSVEPRTDYGAARTSPAWFVPVDLAGAFA